jgi:hypothetical protein
MTSPAARLPDPARTKLRAAVAAVDGALSQPSVAGEAASPGRLEAAWHELVELLALGPEPDYRECPTCGATAMREATVCGHCWTHLAPLEAAARDSESASGGGTS